MDESFYVVTKKLLSIIKDPELKKLIIVGYAKILDSRIKRSEKELDELKKIPKF